jgi:magnesium-transporting ATPase (P-type)
MANKKPSRIKNLGIAGISALTGCVSLIVVLGALLLGLWVDSFLGHDTRIATLCLLVASVPLSLLLMVRMALGLVRQIEPSVSADRDTNTHNKEV